MAKKYYGKFASFLLVIVIAVVGFCFGSVGLFAYKSYVETSNIKVYTVGAISFHFLELGNQNTGDCTYIKAGNVDILIDAGSRYSSLPVITSYINKHVTDNKLEYVIVTHAHKDHYAGFATNSETDSIFDMYEIGVIIDFAQTTTEKLSEDMYINYQRELREAVERGAKHYTALDCINKTNGATNVYNITKDVTMEILNQKYYSQASSNENNHSVCTLFSHGEKHFLFTGDLEKSGEESLVKLNDLPKCELFKAGHHGSITSSNECLLEVIQPKICCVCCCAGNYEYASKSENTFPSQDFVNRISAYTTKVYVTTLGKIKENGSGGYVSDGFESMNGNICVTSTSSSTLVECSHNNTLLKDTAWFKANRTCPSYWS